VVHEIGRKQWVGEENIGVGGKLVKKECVNE